MLSQERSLRTNFMYCVLPPFPTWWLLVAFNTMPTTLHQCRLVRCPHAIKLGALYASETKPSRRGQRVGRLYAPLFSSQCGLATMVHPHLQQRGGTATTELSRTLCGHTFSAEDHRLLCAVARARGWTGRVWVPVSVMEILSFSLAPNTCVPVRLVSSNRSVWVYHSSQFIVPLSVLRERWRAHVHHLESAEKDREATLLASQVTLDALPLSTNGERFDSATEECMLRRAGGCVKARRYWATAAEAKWLYRTPFTDAYLADPENCVVSHANELCRPLALYNVEGTVDPNRFTAFTCRRYDPVNHRGHFYRPAVAVYMKAFALQYDCLHEPQWITLSRAAKLGLSLLPHIAPLSFFRGTPVLLISIGATQRRSTPTSGVPPAIAADAAVASKDVLSDSECCREESLLVPPLS
ncbi:hypothetical protein LPMP_160100 [Leishmania panamensis]|uniref:Trypanosoma Tc-38 (p38) protein domain-containing protein n=1 Tax=Leishmania panamensis TaxID=5679 RepID=A0A088S5S4_LEIPA|nr:hypothetical protein LPMP_160100 [Leishmania panamensis]AIN96886.1 hypothetical protein LPMP_160100 [Leishmania panamensis]